MRGWMLCVGMGMGLLAAPGCTATPGTPLGVAAAANDAAAVRRLLADGHPPDETATGDGEPAPQPAGHSLTPLMWAARRGALDAITLLLDAGADPNARDARNEWTPLQHAIHTRRRDAALLLLDRGANPNARSAPGRLTPLLMAAGSPDPAIVAALLSHGADPRIEGEYGGHAAGPRCVGRRAERHRRAAARRLSSRDRACAPLARSNAARAR